jgi:hypothetical protein
MFSTFWLGQVMYGLEPGWLIINMWMDIGKGKDPMENCLIIPLPPFHI